MTVAEIIKQSQKDVFEHIKEAKRWGYSPDPWAVTIAELTTSLQACQKQLKECTDLQY